MARATASGTISIGLVTIPVKLYTATSAKGVSFNELHACPGGKYSRTKQQLRCAAEDKNIERSELVKGLEVSMDQYAVFSADELEALKASRPAVLSIVAFVPAGSVDPLLVEKTTFLGPDKGGAHGYALLAEEMRNRRRVAIGTFASRSAKDVLVMLRPYGRGLAVHELFYADEVRSVDDIDGVGAPIELAAKELRLMGQLIARMSGKFEHAIYRDTWAEKVLAIAKAKLSNGDVAIPEPPATRQPSDLVDALERSLVQSGPRKTAKRSSSRAA